MDPFSAAAVGVGGGIFGAIAGLFGADEAARQERGTMDDVRAGLREGYDSSQRHTQQMMSSPEFQKARNWYLQMFSNPQSNPMMQNYRGSLRQAQTERGTYFGPAGAGDEAQRMAGMMTQFQSQLAPQLLGLAERPELFRQQIFPQLAELTTRQRTGGKIGWSSGWQGAPFAPGPVSSMLSGGLGGLSAGANIGGFMYNAYNGNNQMRR